MKKARSRNPATSSTKCQSKTLTQCPIIDDGGHAADQLAAGVAHQVAAHSLCTVMAAIALIVLLSAVSCWIPCIEHLHAGVSRYQGNLNASVWEKFGEKKTDIYCTGGSLWEQMWAFPDRMNWSYRVHKKDSIGCSVENAVGILIACELKAKGVSHTPLKTYWVRWDHKPEPSTPTAAFNTISHSTSILSGLCAHMLELLTWFQKAKGQWVCHHLGWCFHRGCW